MFAIKNLTGRNVIFQGMTILPYAQVMVSSIYDFTALSKFTNAGKLSYTRIEPKNEEVKKKPVKVEVPVIKEDVKPVVEVKQEPKKEEIKQEPKKEVKEEVKPVEVEPVVEETKTVDNVEEKIEEKEVKDTKKKNTSSKKYNKKWDN